jgi:hypothetical protein
MILLCKNERTDQVIKVHECRGFLGELTDKQMESLKSGGYMRFRCKKCPSHMRWIKVYYDDGKLIFDADGGKPDFKNIVKYDIVQKFQQVG